MRDEYIVKYNKDLGMYVLYINDAAFMKNKSKSTLFKKAARWLQSQGQ